MKEDIEVEFEVCKLKLFVFQFSVSSQQTLPAGGAFPYRIPIQNQTSYGSSIALPPTQFPVNIAALLPHHDDLSAYSVFPDVPSQRALLPKGYPIRNLATTRGTDI